MFPFVGSGAVPGSLVDGTIMYPVRFCTDPEVQRSTQIERPTEPNDHTRSPMSDFDYDAIVIGAGIAGLCCAGELVLQGAKPLLISETSEVGFAMRSIMVGANRGIIQVPTLQCGWGKQGGWWGDLVRRLNAPVWAPQGSGAIDFTITLKGNPTPLTIPQTVFSAAGLRHALATIFPVPNEMQDDLERVAHIGLNIPFEDLIEMNDILMTSWLEEQKTDPGVVELFLLLSSFALATTVEFCREHVSVYGWFSTVRSYFMAEASFGWLYPDNRHGLAVPLAQAIEQQGGTVWRGRKVAHVDIRDGRARGVVMEDGEVVTARSVAMACANTRTEQLVDPLPPEVEPGIAYTREIAQRMFCIFAVLDEPLVPAEIRHAVAVIDLADQGPVVAAPLHAMAPWTTEVGKQFFHICRCLPVADVADRGGDDVIIKGMHDTIEELWPGFGSAISDSKTVILKPDHLWFNNVSVGPKLPRQSTSVTGLYFVNECSEPTAATFMDGSASAGILGARSMVNEQRS